MQAKAEAEAEAMLNRLFNARGRRALLRPPRAAKPAPAARLPADLVPHDARTAAAAVAALLGVDAAIVTEAVGLTGGEADDWIDDAL